MTLGQSLEVPKRSGPLSGSARAAVTDTLARWVKLQVFLSYCSGGRKSQIWVLAWSVLCLPVAGKRLLAVSSRGGKRGLRSLPLLMRVPVPSRGVGLNDHI